MLTAYMLITAIALLIHSKLLWDYTDRLEKVHTEEAKVLINICAVFSVALILFSACTIVAIFVVNMPSPV